MTVTGQLSGLIEKAVGPFFADPQFGVAFIAPNLDSIIEDFCRSQKEADIDERYPIFFGCKDNIDVSGWPTRIGLKKNGRSARGDAEVVKRLRRQGYVCLGKTTMPEFALSGLGISYSLDIPQSAIANKLPCCPGGSSSGSAVAVANGYVRMALGTDTGGSVRIPAAWNAVIGYASSYGRVSPDGISPLSKSLDSVGALTSSVEEVVRVAAILASSESRWLEMRPDVIIPETMIDGCSPEIQATFEEVVHEMSTYFQTRREKTHPCIEYARSFFRDCGNITIHELIQNYPENLLKEVSERSPYLESILASSSAQSFKSDRGLIELRQIRDTVRRRPPNEILLFPTVPSVPVPLSIMHDMTAAKEMDSQVISRLRFSNLCGMPSLSLPTPSRNLATSSICLCGMPTQDAFLLQTAVSLQRHGLLHEDNRPKARTDW